MVRILLLDRSKDLRAGRLRDESILSKVFRVQCRLVRLGHRVGIPPPAASRHGNTTAKSLSSHVIRSMQASEVQAQVKARFSYESQIALPIHSDNFQQPLSPHQNARPYR